MIRARRRNTLVVSPQQYALFDLAGISLAVQASQPRHISEIAPHTDAFKGHQFSTECHNTLFRIIPDTVTAPKGQAAKLRTNLAAIETLKHILADNQNGSARPATANELQTLVQYTGWGSLSQLWNQEAYNAWQTAQTTEHTIPSDYTHWVTQFSKSRQRLEVLLSTEEKAEAAASTLNAFYTTPEVITAIWQVVEQFGFTGGRILEPAAGIGHFYGLMPDAIARQSELVAVEKDLISGQILQLLYPTVETHLTGFEHCQFENGSFDLIIGNVPFGAYSIYDRHNTDLSGFSIHNYFIGRAARLVRPGGLVALITSAGTLDANGETFRHYLSSEGGMELAGAVRLPSNAFEANAGTVVTTDILFLVKREGPKRRFADHSFERTITLRNGRY